MRFRKPSRMPGLGRLVMTQAISESVVRVRDQREVAVARAREAIGARAAEPELDALLEAGGQSIDRAAMTWPRQTIDAGEHDAFEEALRAVRVLFEWAALASVGAGAMADEDFSTLYGPWWRAVILDVRPVWATRWSTTSLAGCWITLAGVVLAPIVNRGDAGYLTLGIIVLGSIVWGVGAMFSSARSRPWPEARRSGGLGAGGTPQALLHWLWRAPETIVWRFVRFSQLR